MGIKLDNYKDGGKWKDWQGLKNWEKWLDGEEEEEKDEEEEDEEKKKEC